MAIAPGARCRRGLQSPTDKVNCCSILRVWHLFCCLCLFVSIAAPLWRLGLNFTDRLIRNRNHTTSPHTYGCATQHTKKNNNPNLKSRESMQHPPMVYGPPARACTQARQSGRRRRPTRDDGQVRSLGQGGVHSAFLFLFLCWCQCAPVPVPDRWCCANDCKILFRLMAYRRFARQRRG